MLRFTSLATAALLAVAVTAPAQACDSTALRTRLVECGKQSCLVISGHRADAGAKVLINGHEVTAQGQRHWKARLPVATVRAWSEPHARTISVAVNEVVEDARLPVGLLAPQGNLAMLVVSVK